MIIFDLDGTLADTLPDAAAGINAACKEMKYPPMDLLKTAAVPN
ncbi:MAG TPA: hypothetical protein ENN03_05175 [bacterium]|nr:hypothetical protein [bacterium]